MPEPIKRSLTYRGKCIVCGDSTVGKTATVQAYCSDGAQYPKTYTMTTGVDLTVKAVNILESPDTVELFLYDTAGKDTFLDLVQNHMKDTAMMVYVFDVTCEQSFMNVSTWYQQIEKANPGKVIPGVLIGNKCDLTERQMITNEMAEQLAEKLGLKYFMCSAKDMIHVESPFLYLAQEYHNQMSTTPQI